MTERILPLDNQLERLTKGDAITIVISKSGDRGPSFIDAEFGDFEPSPQTPLGLLVEHIGFDGMIPFAGSSVGIESIIVGEGNDARVVFHNSNVRFPFPPPFRENIFTPEGRRENVQRKVDLGLGSKDEIEKALGR